MERMALRALHTTVQGYKPQPSSCFIITDPKKREVFAAKFIDRIVLLNPVNDCIVIGPSSDWDDLPHDKLLYYSPEGCFR